MDRYQQLSYQKDFKIAFLKARGNAFQRLFETLMGKIYPNDFIACRPWGNIGDRRNDGYLSSKRILFQVYAPNEMSASKAISKINEDFEGAKEHWEEYFLIITDLGEGRDTLPTKLISKGFLANFHGSKIC
jgi:hypothetical protein